MSSGQVAGWAQTDLPVYAAGVFSADHVPSSPPVSADWPYADLTYLDTAGRGVNTASYGNNAWQISTTEHDAKGNVIRTLSAENRNQALAHAGLHLASEEAGAIGSTGATTNYYSGGSATWRHPPARRDGPVGPPCWARADPGRLAKYSGGKE
jgi:hypothetical protein